MLSVAITAGVSAVTALVAVVVTNFFTRRREHEADWRKLKLAQYQQFILALSGVEDGRATLDAMRQYTDAMNAMSLIAPMSVLHALRAYQAETSYKNINRSQAEHDRLLNLLVRALRADVQPSNPLDDPAFRFMLFGLPPERHQSDEPNQESEPS